ncbi:TIGR02099 family protein [Microbulbifer sp. OS29]|uniref:TIGR02099 family protein n=1 Tax=Microbulbifer okhotskensis TaxID=2926617 RepID=A0A9X2EMF8_9GAMM|nr:YhdP family protein [Microbulbifer okhotskensis]MCO1333785.1 TIGR02099 family protein [Microbulbifer okhotskensis]
MAAIRWIARKFWLLSVSLVIALAIIVQTGRLLSPQVESYRPQISNWLTEQLGVPVQMDRISLHWEALEVALQLDGLRLGENGELRMGHGLFQLDLLSSLWNRELVWKDLQMHSFSAALSRDGKGEWHLEGFPDVPLKLEGNAATNSEAADPARLFQLSPKIQIRNAAITVRLPDEQLAEVNLPEIQLENSGNFHRLTARAFISRDGESSQADEETLRVILEGRGNPKDKKHFSLQGYIQLNELLLDDDIVALLHELTPLPDRFHWRGRKWADGRLWLRSDLDNGYRIAGQVDLAQVESSADVEVAAIEEPALVPLQAFSGDLSGRWLPGEYWRLALQNIQIDWQGLEMPPLNLQMSSDREGLALMADVVDLAGWSGILSRLELLEGAADEWLRALKPSGQLHSVHLRAGAGRQFELGAKLQDISVDAFRGAPAVSHLSGYLQLEGASGRVELDGSVLGAHFPSLYKNSFAFERASGTIAWTVDKESNEVSVLSGPLHLEGELGNVGGQFLLTLPFYAQTRPSELVLSLSLNDTEVAVQEDLVPFIVSDDLRKWLKSGLGEDNRGRVESAAFVYRGSSYRKEGKDESLRILGAHPKRRTIQLALDFSGASLDYASEWPAVRDVDGRLLLDDGTVRVNADRAKLWNMDARDIQVGVTPLASKGSRLDVRTGVAGPAADGLRLLRESPLRDHLGQAFDDWSLSGQLDGVLALTMPLGGASLAPRQNIELNLDKGNLTLEGLRLDATALSGLIKYDSSQGLEGTLLDGKLWGRPLTARIRHFGEGEARNTQVVVDGSALIESVHAWSSRPELQWLEGAMDYQALVTLPAKSEGAPYAAVFELTSNLAGVAVNLPEPLGKEAPTETNFVLRVPIGEQGSLFHMNYGEHLQGQFWLIDGELDRAAIALNAEAQLPLERELSVTGDISTVDLPRWEKLLGIYHSTGSVSPTVASLAGGSTAPAKQGEKPAQPLPIRLDLSTDQLQLGSVEIDHIHVTGLGQGADWQLNFDSEMAAGDLTGSLGGDAPLRLKLTHLRIPSPEKKSESSQDEFPLDPFSEEASDPLVRFDFTRIPNIDFSASTLQVGDENMGPWSFKLRSSEGRLLLNDIHGVVRGFRLTGRDKGDERLGAQLLWARDAEGQESSQFIGRLVADDLADIQREMGHQPVIESKSASFDTALQWKGSPTQVKGSLLSGELKIDIRDGRFLRSTGATGSTVLRLLSLFNFDTWARRLRLDFSDLYKSGMAFDRVRGEVVLEGDGQLLIAVPIQVEGPTSELQMAGRVNLLREDLDLTLVATLPVGNNLALVAALAGGLPAAAGVYLISKAFRKQVKKVASVSYRISGGWAAPQMRFEKLFDGDGAKRQGAVSEYRDDKSPMEVSSDEQAPPAA